MKRITINGVEYTIVVNESYQYLEIDDNKGFPTFSMNAAEAKSLAEFILENVETTVRFKNG